MDDLHYAQPFHSAKAAMLKGRDDAADFRVLSLNNAVDASRAENTGVERKLFPTTNNGVMISFTPTTSWISTSRPKSRRDSTIAQVSRFYHAQGFYTVSKNVDNTQENGTPRVNAFWVAP